MAGARTARTAARAAPRRATPRARRAAWLAEPMRRALGPELLAALHPGEDVALVTPASVWASPQALLAVTDRRLLWLLDDAVTGRVRSLDLAAITGVETRLAWPRRRTRVAARRAPQRAPAARASASCGPRRRDAIARRCSRAKVRAA